MRVHPEVDGVELDSVSRRLEVCEQARLQGVVQLSGPTRSCTAALLANSPAGEFHGRCIAAALLLIRWYRVASMAIGDLIAMRSAKWRIWVSCPWDRLVAGLNLALRL